MLNWIKYNPSAITGAVMALVNMLVAYGVHLTADQAKSVGVITGAVLTIIVVATTRPVGLQLLIGAGTTIVGALGAFHFHPTSAQVSSAATVLSIALGVIFHFAHVPVAASRQGRTAYGLQGVAGYRRNGMAA